MLKKMHLHGNHDDEEVFQSSSSDEPAELQDKLKDNLHDEKYKDLMELLKS